MAKTRRLISLTRADSRFSPSASVSKTDLDSLEELLSSPTILDLTTLAAGRLGKSKLAALKDVGWWMPGVFDPPERRRGNLKSRSAAVLDADHLPEGATPQSLVDEVALWHGCRAFAHTTFSHRPDRPKARLVVPFAADVEPARCELASRLIAESLGIGQFDFTTHQPSRIMYLPSVCSDGQFLCAGNGEAALYDCGGGDLPPVSEWPRHGGEPPLREAQAQARHPHGKPGVVGAFCRAFPIEDGIVRFGLPYEHVSGVRWRYAKGSGIDGAVVYPDEDVLHSWHESDPAHGRNCLWDLCRIHLHGGADEDEGLPVAERPSHRATVAWALGLPEVREAAGGEDYASDFEALPDEAALTYGSIEADVLRAANMTRSERSSFVRRIAAAGLSASDTGALASMLAKSSGRQVTKAEALSDIKAERRLLAGGGGEGDVDYMLWEMLLRRHYEGGAHLRRFAKMFWSYADGVWRRTEDEVVKAKTQRLVAHVREGNGDRRLIEAVRGTGTAVYTRGVWPFVQAEAAHLDDGPDPMRLMRLDAEPVVNCRNCEVVFDGEGRRTTRPHDPARMLTHRIDVDYDEDADTSAWDAFVRLLFGAADMRRHIEEVLGYIVQPSRQHATVCVMVGAPAAGKTTIGQLLNLMVGRAAVNTELSRFGGRDSHDTAGLVGKLLLLDEDFKAGGLLPDGFLRRISEAKHMTANPKHASQFEFVCRALPFVIANAWPATRDHAGGLERRALCWEMPAIPPAKRSEDAKLALLSDAGRRGALRRWTEGYSRLRLRGGWDIPAPCVEARDKWLKSSDSTAFWADEEVERQPRAFTARAEMYARYTAWHRSAYPGGRPVGKQEFNQRMRRRFGEGVKRGTAGWDGIALTRATDFG